MSLLDKSGGRRFLMIMGCCLAVTLLRMGEALGETFYTEIIKWAIAVYVGGNVGQRLIEAKYPKNES